jgi:hypothetical protein
MGLMSFFVKSDLVCALYLHGAMSAGQSQMHATYLPSSVLRDLPILKIFLLTSVRWWNPI